MASRPAQVCSSDATWEEPHEQRGGGTKNVGDPHSIKLDSGLSLPTNMGPEAHMAVYWGQDEEGSVHKLRSEGKEHTALM